MEQHNATLPVNEFDFRKELIRKGIHLCSLMIPLGYYFLPKPVALIVMLALALVSVLTDVARFYNASFSAFYYKIFHSILREHEVHAKKKNFTGATYVLISAVLCIALFPKVIAITSFSILIISDTASALFGRKFGKHKFSVGGMKKSWEGSSAFVLSAIAVILVTPKIAYLISEYCYAALAAICGAAAEVFSFDISDDNFAIPLVTGFLLWGMYLIFLPELQINSY